MKTKKIPLSQRPQSEQVRYWVSGALDRLLAGAPTVASENLRKALLLLPQSSKLYSVIVEAHKAACGPSPRLADHIVKQALHLIQEKP